LAVLSGTAGVLATSIALPLLQTWLPPLPRLDEMRLDLSVLAFGVFMSAVSGLVFGVTPALRASRVDLSRSLMLLGRSTADSSRVWMQQTLIVAQIALATMLVVGAALLLQGFGRLQQVPLGFESGNVLTARLSLPRTGYPDPARSAQFYERILATLQGSEQVQAAAIPTRRRCA
jgi:putative ABC transport system permease protein